MDKKVFTVYDLLVIAKSAGEETGTVGQTERCCSVSAGSHIRGGERDNRVQVFDSSANFIRSIGEKTGSNKMLAPYGLFVREDMVYVTLPGQHCIQMYTCQGMFVREKGRQGREEGRLKSPTG